MKKSYYAIIPANVRYDKELTNGAKLLYGEITALSNEKGYCWATNAYFAELYGVSKVTISKWINQLVERGYVSSEIVYKEGTKEISGRYLRILNDPIKENFNTPIKENFNTPIKENFTENNTDINNTEEYIYIREIYEYWNSKGIIKHRKMTAQMKSHINARLKEYSLEELKKAIDNYSTVLSDDKYYWTHKWTLHEFMKPNNVARFVDDAAPLDNFLDRSKRNRKSQSIGEVDF